MEQKVVIAHIASLDPKSKTWFYTALKAQIALMIAKKVTVPTKYLNYVDVFLKKFTTKLPKRSNINQQIINLKHDKQLSYGPISSLKLIELLIVKTYIEINLAKDFICPLILMLKPQFSLSKNQIVAFICM